VLNFWYHDKCLSKISQWNIRQTAPTAFISRVLKNKYQVNRYRHNCFIDGWQKKIKFIWGFYDDKKYWSFAQLPPIVFFLFKWHQTVVYFLMSFCDWSRSILFLFWQIYWLNYFHAHSFMWRIFTSILIHFLVINVAYYCLYWFQYPINECI